MKYQIRIEGELGQEWADWFGGPAISREGDGVTLLTCAVADQAALHGLLRKLRDLGLPLLSVNRIDDRRKIMISENAFRASSYSLTTILITLNKGDRK